MQIPTDLLFYAKWSGILTVVSLVIAILGFIFKWGIRFRFVGITAFLIVVTSSVLALKLSLFTSVSIPGARRYTLVYDNSSDQVVVNIPPETITPEEAAATLRQAAYNLFSPGRSSYGENQLTVRLRTILHPEPGVSQPVYLGQVKRSLLQRQDENMEVEVFEDNLALL